MNIRIWICCLSCFLSVMSVAQIKVVSHRGDWRNAPENSLQAIRNCIEMGVDMVEIDLKRTKDGQLILMHDQQIDRTTTGKGKPQDYTLEELKKFRLKNGAGHRTAHTIPSLKEALLLAKDKIRLNIDKGYDYFPEVHQLLKETGTMNQVLVKSSLSYEQVKAENGKVLEEVMFMPVIQLNEEDAASRMDAYLRHIKPYAFECVFDEATPQVLSLLQKLKEQNQCIWINSLWPELCGGHDDDCAVESGKPEDSWGWLLQMGCTFIQTDRPLLLIAYLNSKNLHH